LCVLSFGVNGVEFGIIIAEFGLIAVECGATAIGNSVLNVTNLVFCNLLVKLV